MFVGKCKPVVVFLELRFVGMLVDDFLARSACFGLGSQKHERYKPITHIGEITNDPKGVLKLLNSLKIHKASGPDGLSAWVLRECSSEIASILALIYTESLAE